MKSNEELIKEYIKKYSTKGYSNEQIKKALLNSGIDKKYISKYLKTSSYKKWFWIVPLILVAIFLLLMLIFWLTKYVFA